jgi:hypothetical protein
MEHHDERVLLRGLGDPRAKRQPQLSGHAIPGALAIDEGTELADAEAVDLAETEATGLGAAGVTVPHPAVKAPMIVIARPRVSVLFLMTHRTVLAASGCFR